MNTFFLRSLTLCVPICRHFQSNGDNWRSIKHRENFFYIIEHYIIFFVQRLILRQLAPFDWKCLQIGTQRAKDLRKNVFIFLRGEFTLAPWTLLVIRVVLLQWLYELSILSSHKCTWVHSLDLKDSSKNAFWQLYSIPLIESNC